MTEPARNKAAPEWRFAVTLYGRSGVAPACLALQDKWQVDVSLMIAMLYAGLVAARPIDAAAVAAADAAVAGWRTSVVQPLRRTRQEMKGMPALARHAAARDLREQIKAAELKAEQIELMELARWIADRPASGDSRINAASIAAAVVSYFAGTDSATTDPETAGHIAGIAAAAEQVATEQVPA